jgi:hypothetical protein
MDDHCINCQYTQGIKAWKVLMNGVFVKAKCWLLDDWILQPTTARPCDDFKRGE